jgi:hypothetical protein
MVSTQITTTGRARCVFIYLAEEVRLEVGEADVLKRVGHEVHARLQRMRLEALGGLVDGSGVS